MRSKHNKRNPVVVFLVFHFVRESGKGKNERQRASRAASRELSICPARGTYNLQVTSRMSTGAVHDSERGRDGECRAHVFTQDDGQSKEITMTRIAIICILAHAARHTGQLENLESNVQLLSRLGHRGSIRANQSSRAAASRRHLAPGNKF